MNKIIDKVKTFSSHTVDEAKKCTWPNKQELVESTAVVIISLAILIGAVTLFDATFSKLIDLLIG